MGYCTELINKKYLQQFYKELKFQKEKIEIIDSQVYSFENLQKIDLSRNNIAVL